MILSKIRFKICTNVFDLTTTVKNEPVIAPQNGNQIPPRQVSFPEPADIVLPEFLFKYQMVRYPKDIHSCLHGNEHLPSV